MTNTVFKFLRDKNGSTAIEYGLIASLIVVVVIGGMSAVGTATENVYNDLNDQVSDAGN